MYDSMFKLLDLTPLTFSVSSAKRNYKRIMSVIHPDKNDSEHSAEVSKAVNHAYVTLLDNYKRMYYMQCGTPSVHESYDEPKAAETVKLLRGLLQESSRQKEERSQVSPDQQDLDATKENRNNRSDSPGVETRFEAFIKECRSAAARTGSHGSSLSGQHSSSPPTSGSNPSVSKKHQKPVHADTQDRSARDSKQTPEFATKRSSSPSTTKPEVIELDSEDDADVDSQSNFSVNWERVFLNGRFSSASSFSGSSDKEDPVSSSPRAGDNSGPDLPRTSTPEPFNNTSGAARPVSPSTSSGKSRVRVDSSTSPLKGTHVDVGTSPFQPSEKLSFLYVMSSPAVEVYSMTAPATRESPSAGVRRNLSSSFGSSKRPSGFSRSENSSPNRGGSQSRFSPNDYLPGYTSGAASVDPAQRLYIMDILSMRSRAGEVTFKVKWGPLGYECIEKVETVVQERKGLQNWLYKLRFQEPRRFKAILRFHPEFLVVLGGVHGGPRQDTSSSSNATDGCGPVRGNATFN